MASGSTVQDRTREPESRGRFAPGLTPLSLFLVLVLFWVLTKTGLVLVLGLLALLLGTVLEGPVRRLEDRHFPRAAAIATVYAVLIGSVVALVLLLMPAVRSQADDFQEQIPVQLRELEQDWEESSNPILSGPGRDFLRTGIEFFEEPTSADVAVPDDAAQRAIPIVTTVGGALVSTLTLLVITFYYLLEKKLIRGLVIEQLSPKFHPRVDRLWTEVENKVGGWMRGQLMLCLIIGTIATISYGIIGLSFWPLLGLWAGITEIIPIVGPWLGGIPAVIVALTQGWQTALIVGLIILGMQSLENWFLVPRVMRGAVGLTPLAVFLAILAGTQLMGIPGAVLAIPIAATIQVILTDWIDQRKIRRTSEVEPVSGWRWMLNRGVGRENAPDASDGARGSGAPTGRRQSVSDQDVLGRENVGEGPQGDAGPDPDRESDETAVATWPANPWKNRGSDASAGQAWRGMPRPKRPGTPPASPAGEPVQRDGTSTETVDNKDDGT